MLSELEKLSIFWSETADYVLVYGIYALIVCAVIGFADLKRVRGAGTSLAGIVRYNALLAVLATVMFTLSMLVTGWYSNLFGGEIGAFAFTLALTLLALYFFKAYSIEQLSPGHRALLPGILAAAVLALPYLLGAVFVYLLASGMQN